MDNVPGACISSPNQPLRDKKSAFEAHKEMIRSGVSKGLTAHPVMQWLQDPHLPPVLARVVMQYFLTAYPFQSKTPAEIERLPADKRERARAIAHLEAEMSLGRYPLLFDVPSLIGAARVQSFSLNRRGDAFSLTISGNNGEHGICFGMDLGLKSDLILHDGKASVIEVPAGKGRAPFYSGGVTLWQGGDVPFGIFGDGDQFQFIPPIE